jgi:hypothetical protein
MAKSLKEIQHEQKQRKKRAQAQRDGEVKGLLYVRGKAMEVDGITLVAAHNLARIIDRRIAELSGPEVV